MFSRFKKVFKVAAIVVASLIVLLLVGVSLTDIPHFLGQYEQAKNRARLAQLPSTFEEYKGMYGITEENNAMNAFPAFELPLEVPSTFRDEDWTKLWELNRDKLPSLQLAIQKPKFARPFLEMYDNRLPLWNLLIQWRANKAIVSADWKEVANLVDTMSQISRLDQSSFDSNTEKILVGILMHHWDDSKWLSYVHETVQGIPLFTDIKSVIKLSHAGSCEYFNERQPFVKQGISRCLFRD